MTVEQARAIRQAHQKRHAEKAEAERNRIEYEKRVDWLIKAADTSREIMIEFEREIKKEKTRYNKQFKTERGEWYGHDYGSVSITTVRTETIYEAYYEYSTNRNYW